MRKSAIILGLLFACTCEVFCQMQMGYREGLIVTQTNDTIQCFVPVASSFGDKILIKRTKNSDPEIFLLKDIKYLATSTNAYENISYVNNGKEMHKLMWMEIEGKMNLYVEIETKISGNQTVSWSKLDAVKTYVIKKNDSTYLIREKNFIDGIKPVIEDNPNAFAKVENGFYTYSSIEELVKDYNGN